MKLRTKSKLKGILIPAIAALFLGAGAMSACSSSGEESAPDAAMSEDGAVSNSDPLANNADGAGAEGATTDAAGGGNEELSNLVNDGSASAASAENPAANAALSNNAGADPFANPAAADANAAAGAADTSGAGLSNGADPFAAANGAAAPNATVSAESAPTNPTADPAADPTAAAAAAGAAGGTDAAANGAVPMNPAPMNPAAAPAEAVATNSASAAEVPAASPAASGPSSGYVPENGSKMAYYVQKRDTLGTISQKIFGKKTQWRELASANNLQDPNRIYAGDVIYYSVGDSSRSFADKYESAPRQTVTVAQGDTLSSISAKVYGSEGSWRTLWKENPQVKNPDVLKVGTTLSYRGAAQAAILSNDAQGVASTEQE